MESAASADGTVGPLSHAIYPVLVFDKDDAIVRGHIALKQACTQEDVPAETGWLWHESVWNYNASFAAHVYLWAGFAEWADRTFRGFLNHASPLYCWREEQPLQRALVSQDWGDMPHNWASAECIRYLRHMLVLEDADNLRFLEGWTRTGFRFEEHFSLERTPTRFGRVTLELEPLGSSSGWKLSVGQETVRPAAKVELPVSIFGTKFTHIEGAKFQAKGSKILIDPESRRWTAFWR